MIDRDGKSGGSDNLLNESPSWNTLSLSKSKGSTREADEGESCLSREERSELSQELGNVTERTSALAVATIGDSVGGKRKETIFGEIDELAKLFSSGSISGQSKESRDKPEDTPSWNSNFVVRVLVVLSVTQYSAYMLSALSHVHSVSGLVLAKTQWVLIIPTSIYVLASIISVQLSWGRQYPTNVCIFMVFTTCSALLWMLLTLTASPEVVPLAVECIATSCLSLALFLMMNVEFDVQGMTVYMIGGGIVIVHLMIRLCVAILQYEGKHGSLNWVFAQVCVAHIFGSLGFGYVIFDLQAILQGSRGIAWPNQWLYGVISIYQDIVLLIFEGIKMLQYLVPCTYCKEGVHTIWKRWKFQKI